jgi:hypothetical protein
MGDVIHRARYFIYNLGKNVASAAVERLLFESSWVPTLVCHHMLAAMVRSAPSQNIFAEKLGSFGFDPFVMLVVDLMHEFELGVWKATFTHLLRILYAIAPGGSLVTELNRRFVVQFIWA